MAGATSHLGDDAGVLTQVPVNVNGVAAIAQADQKRGKGLQLEPADNPLGKHVVGDVLPGLYLEMGQSIERGSLCQDFLDLLKLLGICTLGEQWPRVFTVHAL